MDFLINEGELAALYGLPHIQQLSYLRGIRPYMDLKTGLVGVKRRISYQSISEQLFVEPHQGIKAISYSRSQLRRALSGLERAGLIKIQSEGMQLILSCLLATKHYFVQNKAGTNPSQQPIIRKLGKDIDSKGFSVEEAFKPDTGEIEKADIPHKENNYIYLLSQFEKFWALYPEKKSKANAQAIFNQTNPDSLLFAQIMQALHAQINHRELLMLNGVWVPPWKYPANWLAQRCWEDELFTDVLQEKTHAEHTKIYGERTTTKKDMFCPPSEDIEPTTSNVIEFKRQF